MGASLGATRSLRGALSEIAQSSRRLVSGLRITSADDDAAGLEVAERFRVGIASLGLVRLNIADEIGLCSIRSRWSE